VTSLAFDLAQLKLLQGDSPFSAGDTAWVIMATSLVLLMTIPGLALFYGGLVRVQNVLSTVMQSFSIACLITVEWMVAGYSLSFTRGGIIYGDHSRMWLTGLTMTSSHPLMPTVPEPIFCMFQLTFAIITPALICGSFADRLKFGPMLVFMGAWHLLVYCPLSHAMWTDVSQSYPVTCLAV
jgi:Amt family ammonium transporter